MGRWNAVSVCVPLLGLYAVEGYARHGSVEMGDFKVFGGGANKLVADLRKAIGAEDGDINGLEENLPTPHEASILSGESEMDDEPESMLEMGEGVMDSEFYNDEEDEDHVDDEEEEEEASFMDTHTERDDDEGLEDSKMQDDADAEDGVEQEEQNEVESSFLEGLDDSKMQDDADAEDEIEQEEENEADASFLEGLDDSKMQDDADAEDEIEQEEENETDASFLEGHDDSKMHDDADAEDEVEQEEENETDASFLEGQSDPEDAEDFEDDDVHANGWEGDEDEFEPEGAVADPYGAGAESEIAGASYLEEDVETDQEAGAESPADEEEDLEEQEPEEEEKAEASFIDDSEEEDQMAASFIQLGIKRDIRLHDHNRGRPSFVQAQPTPLEVSDQTAAEDEMLSEAGENPAGPADSSRPAESEPSLDEPPTEPGMADAGEGKDTNDMLGSPQGAESSAEDEQPEGESYRGPADPMIRYGGTANEDVEAEESGMPPAEENAPESLQKKAEEAGIEQEEMPATTEEELAADLQGSFPRIPEAQPHVVQRRHVDQDIRMTEALRTEGRAGGTSGSYIPTTLTAILVACMSIAFF